VKPQRSGLSVRPEAPSDAIDGGQQPAYTIEWGCNQISTDVLSESWSVALMLVVGLFSGIGGLEVGLAKAGHQSIALCEIDPFARSVLESRLGLPVETDVRQLASLPDCDLLTAGFPCQDLSQAGTKHGIAGARSGLVGEVFRLCSGPGAPKTVLLENVHYMLKLGSGRAMEVLTAAFEDLGYRWSYRVVDSRSFGIPQRRQRVLFLASKELAPERVLMADHAQDPSKEHDAPSTEIDPDRLYGFYWTEGLRGLGWTRDAVPTIKGGSTIGIPSPPAIWDPSTGFIGTPSIIDAERLQGFMGDWTEPAEYVHQGARRRWHLVGNAVCVPMAEWIGRRLNRPAEPSELPEPLPFPHRNWPKAAAGRSGERCAYDISMRVYPHVELDLKGFLRDDLKPLSKRASNGFLERAYRPDNRIFIPPQLLHDLGENLQLRILESAA
jgi:DNA (cytosine-5)-methyltransferase 1